MITDQQLDELEKSRQKDSDWYLSKIDLISKLQEYGQVKTAGAKALGLMLAKDIDVSVIVDKIKTEKWQELVCELMVTPHVRNISAIDYYNYNEQNRYDPEDGQKYSLYISINNILGPEGDKFDTWECQIHLIEPDKFDESKITNIKNKLSPEKRIVILRLKYWANLVNEVLKPTTNGDYKIFSPSIYEAVLNNDVSDVDMFIQKFKQSMPDQFTEAFDLAVTKVSEKL
ncbi:hypothetical protein ACFL2V_21830 [Pseudomonadota bacterium]